MRIKVKNIEQVFHIINNGDGGRDFLVVLQGGLRSWKRISLNNSGDVHITHMVDSSEEVMSKTALKLDSDHIINKAIRGIQLYHVPEIVEVTDVMGS